MIKNRFHVLQRREVRDEELQRSYNPLLMMMALGLSPIHPNHEMHFPWTQCHPSKLSSNHGPRHSIMNPSISDQNKVSIIYVCPCFWMIGQPTTGNNRRRAPLLAERKMIYWKEKLQPFPDRQQHVI
jgi:hypothetical protein